MERTAYINLTTVFVGILWLVWFEQPTLAYVDPGSASYLFQLLAGAVLAGVYLLRVYWARMKGSIAELFSRTRSGR